MISDFVETKWSTLGCNLNDMLGKPEDEVKIWVTRTDANLECPYCKKSEEVVQSMAEVEKAALGPAAAIRAKTNNLTARAVSDVTLTSPVTAQSASKPNAFDYEGIEAILARSRAGKKTCCLPQATKSRIYKSTTLPSP